MKFIDPSSPSSGLDPARMGTDTSVAELVADSVRIVEAIASDLRRIDTSRADAMVLYDLVRTNHEAIAQLEGLNAGVAAAMDRISSEDGSCIRSRDAFRSFGRISDIEAKRAAARGGLLAALPAVGAAATSGRAHHPGQ